MNMDFRRPSGPELQYAPVKTFVPREDAARNSRASRSRFSLKYLLWPLFGAVLVYTVATAGTVALLIIGGIVAGLLALATAACIYAQNNSWF